MLGNTNAREIRNFFLYHSCDGLIFIIGFNLFQIVIDTCCATFAEVQKRGEDFWSEFELYVADMLVGLVVNVALVGMLAPYVRIGQPSVSKSFLGRLQHAYGALPSRYHLSALAEPHKYIW